MLVNMTLKLACVHILFTSLALPFSGQLLAVSTPATQETSQSLHSLLPKPLCTLSAGDYILLCTDGLSGTVTDQEMLFEVIHGNDPATCLDRLMAIARSQGAPDNVTAILMRKS